MTSHGPRLQMHTTAQASVSPDTDGPRHQCEAHNGSKDRQRSRHNLNASSYGRVQLLVLTVEATDGDEYTQRLRPVLAGYRGNYHRKRAKDARSLRKASTNAELYKVLWGRNAGCDCADGGAGKASTVLEGTLDMVCLSDPQHEKSAVVLTLYPASSQLQSLPEAQEAVLQSIRQVKVRSQQLHTSDKAQTPEQRTKFGRGKSGITEEQQQAFDRAASVLTADGGIQAPTSSGLLEGRWKLLFTTRPGSASPIQRTFVGVNAFSVYQDISLDPDKPPRVNNVVDFGDRIGQLVVRD
ncbi:hypothetical protein MMC29_000572 [Sticta canariensis]|nr:hypothetical protein [Sticta canariensis]